jgi:hypothetical protein
VEARLRELRLPPPPQPWVWLRTVTPCPPEGDVRVLIVARTRPDLSHLRYVDAPIGADLLFTRAWAGHHYQALGLFRRYHMGGWSIDLTADDLDGRPPMLRLMEPGTDYLQLEVALWWQRAYRPTEDGGEPPLIAELHWRPGQVGPWSSLRVHLPRTHAIASTHLASAQKARGLLYAIQQRLAQGGRPTNREKPQPAKVKIAKDGWKLRESEPVLSWDKIAARVGAPSGKTLQRWIEHDRLHEL